MNTQALQAMNTYRITDLQENQQGKLEIVRTFAVQAIDREAAQEIYIDGCENLGMAHGNLRIERV